MMGWYDDDYYYDPLDYCDYCGCYLRSGIEYRTGECDDCYWEDYFWYDDWY